MIGTIYYLTPKMGCCGMMRQDITFPIPDDYTERDIQEDMLEMMEETESSEADGYQYVITDQGQMIYNLYLDGDKWCYKVKNELKNSSTDYKKLFKY